MTRRTPRPDAPPTLVYSRAGYEVWAKWDEGAEVYELGTDADMVGYVGIADTLAEARTVGAEWVREQEAA